MTDMLKGSQVLQKTFTYIENVTKESRKALMEDFSQNHKGIALNSASDILRQSVLGWFPRRDPMLKLVHEKTSQGKPGDVRMDLDAAGSSAGGYWGAVFTAMVGAYFAYIGYAASTFVAGEIKEANKSLPRTLVIASVLIIALYVSISIIAADSIKGLASQTVGGNSYSLLSAWSFLSYGSGVDLVNAGLPYVKLWTTTIAELTGSGINLGSVNFLLVVFGVFWIANDIPPFILTASRVLFAMSFDRVLP